MRLEVSSAALLVRFAVGKDAALDPHSVTILHEVDVAFAQTVIHIAQRAAHLNIIQLILNHALNLDYVKRLIATAPVWAGHFGP